MIAALIAVVVCVALFVVYLRDREQAWTRERAELLTRIQRPEAVPMIVQGGNWLGPDPEPDDTERVGTISYPGDIDE